MLVVRQVVDSSRAGQSLGSVAVPVRWLTTADDLSLCQPFALHDSGPDTWLTLRLTLRVGSHLLRFN